MAKTLYDHIDAAWIDIFTIIRSKTKGKSLKWKNIKTISKSTWMCTYTGYSKSDLEVTGWVSFYDVPNKNIWNLVVEIEHPMRGKNERTFSFKMHDDYDKIVADAAGHITSFMNN